MKMTNCLLSRNFLDNKFMRSIVPSVSCRKEYGLKLPICISIIINASIVYFISRVEIKSQITHWRLCEVFCILQNLLMCEVPERASDGKASSAIWREPEGISPDRSVYGVVAIPQGSYA